MLVSRCSLLAAKLSLNPSVTMGLGFVLGKMPWVQFRHCCYQSCCVVLIYVFVLQRGLAPICVHRCEMWHYSWWYELKCLLQVLQGRACKNPPFSSNDRQVHLQFLVIYTSLTTGLSPTQLVCQTFSRMTDRLAAWNAIVFKSSCFHRCQAITSDNESIFWIVFNVLNKNLKLVS